MNRIIFAVSLVLVLVAVALPSFAMQKGTFEYGGYTIVVVPYSSAYPGHGGTITITGTTEFATVDLAGEYTTTDRPHPQLSIHLIGTIKASDALYEVDKMWTMAPRETHMVWRTVVNWINSLISA